MELSHETIGRAVTLDAVSRKRKQCPEDPNVGSNYPTRFSRSKYTDPSNSSSLLTSDADVMPLSSAHTRAASPPRSIAEALLSDGRGNGSCSEASNILQAACSAGEWKGSGDPLPSSSHADEGLSPGPPEAPTRERTFEQFRPFSASAPKGPAIQGSSLDGNHASTRGEESEQRGGVAFPLWEGLPWNQQADRGGLAPAPNVSGRASTGPSFSVRSIGTNKSDGTGRSGVTMKEDASTGDAPWGRAEAEHRKGGVLADRILERAWAGSAARSGSVSALTRDSVGVQNCAESPPRGVDSDTGRGNEEERKDGALSDVSGRPRSAMKLKDDVFGRRGPFGGGICSERKRVWCDSDDEERVKEKWPRLKSAAVFSSPRQLGSPSPDSVLLSCGTFTRGETTGDDLCPASGDCVGTPARLEALEDCSPGSSPTTARGDSHGDAGHETTHTTGTSAEKLGNTPRSPLGGSTQGLNSEETLKHCEQQLRDDPRPSHDQSVGHEHLYRDRQSGSVADMESSGRQSGLDPDTSLSDAHDGDGPVFVLSSGRSRNQTGRSKASAAAPRQPTIDDEFEQYFAQMLL